MRKSIEEAEEKIQKFSYTDTLHERIETGRWKLFRHARIPGYKDLRIVYLWKTRQKILTYYRIGTHKELGIN